MLEIVAGQRKANVVACAEILKELRRREQHMGIEADRTVDAMMEAETLEGGKRSISTEFMLRILGLGSCADTMVHSQSKL